MLRMTTEPLPLPSRAAWPFSLGLGGYDPKQTRDLLIFHAVVPVAFGSLLGANQTGIAFHLPWLMSVGYWIVLSLITWQVLHWITTAVAALTRPLHPPITLILLLGATLSTFIMRPFMYKYSGAFSDFLLNGRTVQPMRPFEWTADFLAQHFQLWAGMIIVWVAINLVFDRFVGAPRYRAASIAPRPPAPLVATLHATASPQAMPFDLPPGAEIFALKSEDHYVRVFSSHGEKLILTRISDAIAQLAGIEGARVHRSYWVAKKSVERADAQGRTPTLYLRNGLQVPVSQTYKEMARLAGLVP